MSMEQFIKHLESKNKKSHDEETPRFTCLGQKTSTYIHGTSFDQSIISSHENNGFLLKFIPKTSANTSNSGENTMLPLEASQILTFHHMNHPNNLLEKNQIK
ncbi:hypothetical protein L1049_024222 [Liquidambar formosana]|uniref:Uncharacterized protein n=1 Tax=Liquidambar formosana TaxID=63359 RepID=A0AAP0X4E5_LIQFO